jgi:hypothetical protein
MPMVSVKEWELLSFFEVEPELLEPGEAWDANDAAYTVVRGELELSFAIAPWHRDVRIVLSHRRERVYELNTMSVVDVVYRQEQGVETLTVILTARDTITLRVKPRIELEHDLAPAE